MTARPEVIHMAAVDNQAFLRWLHHKCLRAELVGIALLVAYWLVQIYQCEDDDGTVEIVVTAIVVCALVSRAASGLASSRLPAQLPPYLSIPQNWDGAIWSMLVVLAHGVEASTVAFGSHSRAAAIARPPSPDSRVAHDTYTAIYPSQSIATGRDWPSPRLRTACASSSGWCAG